LLAECKRELEELASQPPLATVSSSALCYVVSADEIKADLEVLDNVGVTE
jgi:hypothetical protein